jgi:membrane-associated phospholipid phosphatase
MLAEPAPKLRLRLAQASGASGQPVAQGEEVARGAAKRSPLLVELAVVAFLGWIYDWLQNLAPLRLSAALRHGRAILSTEAGLGLAPERALDHWLIRYHFLAYISSDFYDNAIFGVTFGLVAWTWWRRPDVYRPLRNYLVLTNLAGFTVFWLYPVAPPRMLPGFIDVVERVGGLGSWHNTLISHADQLAAMPSMHLAWAAWCALAGWRLAPAGRWRWAAGAVGLGYCLATALDVMATGNHYLADVIAGVVCTALSAIAVDVARYAVRRLATAVAPAVFTSGPPRT